MVLKGRKSPFKIKVKFVDQEIPAFAGLIPYLKILVERQYLCHLSDKVSSRQGFANGHMIHALMCLNICGFDRMSSNGKLEYDTSQTQLFRYL